jgi:hypothetical protein
MFFIIATLLGFIIFACVVTDKGSGSPVLNRAYCDYDLQDKVCGKMGRSINGVPETADMPDHNFPHPSQSSP